MNAPLRSYRRTAEDLSSALLGRQRVRQDVKIIARDTLMGVTYYHVSVNDGPERYRVSEDFLGRLKAGQTPEYLDLEDEPLEGAYTPEYATEDRACSRADERYQLRKEQF